MTELNIKLNEMEARRLIVMLNIELRDRKITREYRSDLNSIYEKLTGFSHPQGIEMTGIGGKQ